MTDESAGPDTRPHGDHAWHALAPEQTLDLLDTTSRGLSAVEAERRLQSHGPNRLPRGKRRSALTRLLYQFHNLLIYVLIVAGILAATFGHLTDAAVIFAVVVLNAIIGFVQEGRAEQALDAIRSMIDPQASVVRDGERRTVSAEELVPGDVVLLGAGDRVPADIRLLKASSLAVDEAILTGESLAVDKTTEPVAEDAALGDRRSVAYSGTLVTAGSATGVTVATGAGTELGRISAMLGSVQELTTPLIRQLDEFAKRLTLVVLSVSILVFGYAYLVHGYEAGGAFMAVVGLIVAAIPEGLPAVVTITLAVGVQRMAGRNAIIRRLPAVETLGSVSVICSDKTGTLTRNEMMVHSVALASADLEVTGSGYAPQGTFVAGDETVDPEGDALLAELARAAVLCNDAYLRHDNDDWSISGDPMEGALVSMAAKAGYSATELRDRYPRSSEIPFDAEHRYMASAHQSGDGGRVVYVKGAPERVLLMCSHAATRDGPQPIDTDAWQQRAERIADKGERVLALARGQASEHGDALRHDDVESGLTLLGLVGLQDPPRAAAITAVAECRAAGISVKMITGDHAATARAIARQLGMSENPEAVTGQELEELDDVAFRERARTATVFARTSPEHKLRLVEALQADRSVIAMTGDGVNDAPALKRADVGVAMGGKGTEAAKEASEMVLADDNFASIVAAVREGRTVYDNVTKVIAWTLPTNGGEAFTIVMAILLGLTLPVTPVQILWINMVTAVALGLTLAFEPTEPGTMRRPPRPSSQPLLPGRLLWRVAFVSMLMVTAAFGVYTWAVNRGLEIELARTMVVNTIVVIEIFYLFSVRYVYGSALTWQGVLGTRAVLIGVAIVIAAQALFTYLPAMHTVFETRPVAIGDGLVIVGIGAAVLILIELEKRLVSRLLGSPKGTASISAAAS